MLKIVEAFATILTLVGMAMLSEGLIPWGFVVGAFANIGWLYYGHETDAKGIFVVNLVLLIINVNGFGGF